MTTDSLIQKLEAELKPNSAGDEVTETWACAINRAIRIVRSHTAAPDVLQREISVVGTSPEAKVLQKILDALGIDDVNINSRGLFEDWIRGSMKPVSGNPPGHAIWCGWQLDQYNHECTCGYSNPSSKRDAAAALSKAILEAHAKWQIEYQGVSHG